MVPRHRLQSFAKSTRSPDSSFQGSAAYQADDAPPSGTSIVLSHMPPNIHSAAQRHYVSNDSGFGEVSTRLVTRVTLAIEIQRNDP